MVVLSVLVAASGRFLSKVAGDVDDGTRDDLGFGSNSVSKLPCWSRLRPLA